MSGERQKEEGRVGRVGLCWGCGYALRGLEGRGKGKCPECGREFDSGDERTMNMTGARSRVVRWFLTRPVGKWVVGWSFLAMVMLVAVSGWPTTWRWDFSLVDVRYYFVWGRLATFWQFPKWCGWRDWVFVLGVMVWVVVASWVAMRICGRWWVRRRYKSAYVSMPRRRAVVLGVMMAAGLSMLFLGVDERIVQRALLVNSAWSYATVRVPMGVGSREEDALRHVAMHGWGARNRLSALGLMVENHSHGAERLLPEMLQREGDEAMRVSELLLLGLYRNADTAELLAKDLGHSSWKVRAAAADALGILHRPAFEIESGQSGPPVMIPPGVVGARVIQIDGLPLPSSLGRISSVGGKTVELDGKYREKLEKMMLEGVTREEREAAARALVMWPPEGYRMRVAEWGVWLGEGGEMKLVQAVLDEIPPFVHRTGNRPEEFGDRVAQITMVFKPIIHVTVNRPLAMNMEVQIRKGRPWYAYPRPDDFNLGVRLGEDKSWRAKRRGSDPERRNEVSDDERLEALAPVKGFGRLGDAGEGYPWLRPRHRKFGGIGGGMVSENQIVQMGLVWQSAIVTPAKPRWAKLPEVGVDKRFGWWEGLREVPSGYVTNCGETERFLYYDGPTWSKAPLQVEKLGGKLVFRRPEGEGADEIDEERRVWGDPEWIKSTKDFGRMGMLVRVEGKSAKWVRVPVEERVERDEYGQKKVYAPGNYLVPKAGEFGLDAEGELLKMVMEAGLTEAEGKGMVASWKEAFFEKEGERFLLVMSSEDYDRQCPIAVRPRPTEMVRVGVVWTELK